MKIWLKPSKSHQKRDQKASERINSIRLVQLVRPAQSDRPVRSDGPADRMGQSDRMGQPIDWASRSTGPADRLGQPIQLLFCLPLPFLAYKYPSIHSQTLVLLLLTDQDVPALKSPDFFRFL